MIFYPFIKVKRIIEERYYDIHERYKPISIIDFLKYEEDQTKFVRLLVEIRKNEEIKEDDFKLHKMAAVAESMYIACPESLKWKLISLFGFLLCVNGLVGVILY